MPRKKSAGLGVAEQFFFVNAGYSYDPKKETPTRGKMRGAKAMAKAEARAKRDGYYFTWDDDPGGWDSIGDVDPDSMSRVESCRMISPDGETVQSLGSIIDADQKYRRVIEAELALEEF